MTTTTNPGDSNVIRLYGLTEEECHRVAAEGQRLVERKKGDRVQCHADQRGIRSVSIHGFWGRHFTIHRQRGEVILVGLYGRVLARDRRFEAVLNTLRAHSETTRSFGKF